MASRPKSMSFSQESRATSMMSVTSADFMPSTTDLKVNERVNVRGSRKLMSLKREKLRAGILRYLGETEFAVGHWAGVELDEPLGKNDGSVDGKRYFQCQPKHGLFAPIHKVSRAVEKPPAPPPRTKAWKTSISDKDLKKQAIELQNALASTNSEIRELQEELKDKSRTADELGDKLRVSEEHCNALKAEIKALRETNEANVAHTNDKHEQEIQDMVVRIEQLTRDQSESQMMKETMEDNQQKSQLQNADLHSALQTVEELRSIVLQLEEENSQLHSRATQSNQQNTALKAEAQSKDEEMVNLIQDNANCQTILEELKQRNAENEKAIETVKSENSSLKNRLQKLNEDKLLLMEQKNELSEAFVAIESYQMENQSLKNHLEQLNQEQFKLADVQKELSTARETIDELRSIESALKSQATESHQLIDSLKSDIQSKELAMTEAANKMNADCREDFAALKENEKKMLFENEQLQCEQVTLKEELTALKAKVAILETGKIKWLQDKSTHIQTIECLKAQLNESTTFKEKCNQFFSQFEELNCVLEERSPAGKSLAWRSDAFKYKVGNVGEQTDLRYAIDSVEKIQQLTQQLLGMKREMGNRAEERNKARRDLTRMERIVTAQETEIKQLRTEVYDLKKTGQGSFDWRSHITTETLRNQDRCATVWRDYLLINAIRHAPNQCVFLRDGGIKNR